MATSSNILVNEIGTYRSTISHTYPKNNSLLYLYVSLNSFVKVGVDRQFHIAPLRTNACCANLSEPVWYWSNKWVSISIRDISPSYCSGQYVSICYTPTCWQTNRHIQWADVQQGVVQSRGVVNIMPTWCKVVHIYGYAYINSSLVFSTFRTLLVVYCWTYTQLLLCLVRSVLCAACCVLRAVAVIRNRSFYPTASAVHPKSPSWFILH